MPYGNKTLHFGHIAGVFVPADYYARFLRDRIGEENVLFISGTDCYGSPIMEGARKSEDSDLETFVANNHNKQKEALSAFSISLNYFGGSALYPAKEVHQELTSTILKRLYELAWLKKRETLQFYDEQAHTFLNGRQVEGRCPVRGCKSEKAYADECDMGHQFDPKELIAPVSQLTHTTPVLKKVENWYFSLDTCRDYLKTVEKTWQEDLQVRPVVTKTMAESLIQPRLYIKNEQEAAYKELASSLPEHTFYPSEKNQQSFSLAFLDWQTRDDAERILETAQIRFRAGKCLLPLRLTGNIDWGVSAKALPEAKDLTVWVWPESLWAPISFTKTLLEKAEEVKEAKDALYTPTKAPELSWLSWWADDEAAVYQFIGQDNIYFYCLAQPALWQALDWNLTLDTPVANYHALFLNKKASSSGEIKPPMADELLSYYTPDQLRCHWLSLGLDTKAVSFAPKPLDVTVSTTNKKTGEVTLVKDDPRVVDPALKESAFLTNIFNRLARSCFYGAQKYCDGMLPTQKPLAEVVREAIEAQGAFENAMYRLNFHEALNICETYGRETHKRWDSESKAAQNDQTATEQALANAFCALRTLTLLMHPATPDACEKIAEQLNVDKASFFSWSHAKKSLSDLLGMEGKDAANHKLKPLPPKSDFFKKHPSQYT